MTSLETSSQGFAVIHFLRHDGLEQLEADLEQNSVVSALSRLLMDACLAAAGGDPGLGTVLVRACIESLQDDLA